MIRRFVALMLLMFGVLVTPDLVGSGTPVVSAASPTLTPLNPVRLLDTRADGKTIDGQAQRTGIQTGKSTFELPVTGRGGVPADASAVMLNVTATTPTGLGFITVYPCGIDRPLASNLNYNTTTIPNAVLAKIGADGKVCLYTETTTHILADVNAYVPKDGVPTPLNPARLLDTRPDGKTIDGQAQRTGIQAAKTTFELPVTGRGGVPADASAVMLNVTATTPTGLGFITVYPCGIDRPLASNLNFTNSTIPNAVLAKIGADGKVCFYTETTAHILADVNAYVPKDGVPTPLNPVRLLDTRPDGKTIDGQAQGTGIQTGKTTFELPVAGRGGVPSDASAVMLNVTAATPTGLGFITVYPCGIDRPLASNLNFTTTTIPNAVLAKIGAGGKICFYAETTTHILADVNAYVPSIAGPPAATCANTTIPVAECKALVALYIGTDGPRWSHGDRWNSAADPCIWYGVTCTEDKSHIAAISLKENQLSGTLPPDIRNLTNLTELDLSENKITGLPTEIGQLPNLTDLDLHKNQLSALPPEIGRLAKLNRLTVRRNLLTAMPPEIGQLPNLSNLSLSANKLTALPPEIGQLANLHSLNLSENQLTALPPEIGQLANLHSLNLSENQLTALPPEIGQLANLSSLSLGSNDFAAVPAVITSMIGLESLELSKNKLTTIPPGLAKLTKLTGLYLDRNQISTLPKEIGRLTKLTRLVLDQNRLTALPPGFSKLTNLTSLNLYENQLTALPTDITDLTKLTTVDLSWNQITALPPRIDKLTNVTKLSLYKNKIKSVPPEIGKLGNLTSLNLGSNELTAIPRDIAKLTNLTSLDLSDNKLTALPPEIFTLTKLEHLSASYNALTAVPPAIGNLTNLARLRLARTKISALPPAIGNLTRLGELDLASNGFRAVPPEIFTFQDLTDLNLEFNLITVLPIEIGKLTKLKYLNLSSNELSGDITAAMSPLRQVNQLKDLDLRGNGCVGTTDNDLANWLTGLDKDWRDGC